MRKRSTFLLLLSDAFLLAREFRLRKKIRYKRLRMQRKLAKDEPRHLRRYIVHSGTIRRL